MSALKPLQDLAARGMQPTGRIVWLGLGMKPPKRNAIAIDPIDLPTDDECKAVAGLDVVVLFNGFLTKYGTLQRLCGSLYQARPRRLQLVDMDFKRIAFLRVART
jgi:hypothetical protein